MQIIKVKISDYWLKITAEIFTFENLKNVTNKQTDRQTEKPITEAPLIGVLMKHRVEQVNIERKEKKKRKISLRARASGEAP